MLPSFERRNHGSGVWFVDEIMDALSAVDLANWDITQHIDSQEVRQYRRGYEAALSAVATMFGLAYYPRALYTPTVSEVRGSSSPHTLGVPTPPSMLPSGGES